MTQYDLVILDLMLPGISGKELILLFAGKVPVIVLSARDELDSKVALLSSGASDFMCKPFDLRELLVRIQVQLRNVSFLDNQSALHYKNWILNSDTMEMSVSGERIDSTPHECKILELL